MDVELSPQLSALGTLHDQEPAPLSPPQSCAFLSRLLCIMSPILQTPVTLTIRILLRLLLLRQMSFAICDYSPHVRDVIVVVF